MKNTYAFIIRIWFEAREGSASGPEYRGVIEPVGEGEKTYFYSARQIYAYFSEFLEKQGVRRHWADSIWRRFRGKG